MTNIKRELLTGVFYTAVGKYSNIAIQLIVITVLARLLTPKEHGIIAVATVFITFFNIVSDIGIGPAIIQFKELDKYDLSHIYSLTIYIGIFSSLLFYLGSWPISYYYNEEQLVPVCQLLSLSIFFHCLNIVPQNIQYRKKRFKFAAFVILISNLLSAVIAITLALLGFGVYAIVSQQICAAFFFFAAFYYQDRLSVFLLIDKNSIKKILSFSFYQFLFNIINYFSRNLDKLLVGRYIGIAALGQYEKSYRLMLLPLQNISFAITPVLQPIFSNLQNNRNEMAEKYMKLFVLLCYIGFPLSAFLFFCGKEIVLIAFGGQWYDAILPFRILSLTVGLQMLNGTSGSIYQSANSTKQLFISGCWCALFMTSSFIISIAGWSSIIAVSIAYVIAQILNSAQTYYILFRLLNYPMKRVVLSMMYPLFISFLIGIILLLIYGYCDRFSLLLSLLIKSMLAMIIWSIGINYYGPYRGCIFRLIKRTGMFLKNRL